MFEEGEFSQFWRAFLIEKFLQLMVWLWWLFFLEYSMLPMVSTKKISLLTSGIYFVAEEFPLLAISFGNGVLPG